MIGWLMDALYGNRNKNYPNWYCWCCRNAPDDLGFRITIGFFITFLIFLGLCFAAYVLTHTIELEKAGCKQTPVDWKNGTFYIIDNGAVACPYAK